MHRPNSVDCSSRQLSGFMSETKVIRETAKTLYDKQRQQRCVGNSDNAVWETATTLCGKQRQHYARSSDDAVWETATTLYDEITRSTIHTFFYIYYVLLILEWIGPRMVCGQTNGSHFLGMLQEIYLRPTLRRRFLHSTKRLVLRIMYRVLRKSQ